MENTYEIGEKVVIKSKCGVPSIRTIVATTIKGDYVLDNDMIFNAKGVLVGGRGMTGYFTMQKWEKSVEKEISRNKMIAKIKREVNTMALENLSDLALKDILEVLEENQK